MHPLAHTLTGALVGQAASSPALALIGGVASHVILDRIPHAEGETFAGRRTSAFGIDLIEAAAELVVGLAAVWWVGDTCSSARVASLALGVLGGLLPDLVDLPLKALAGVIVLHKRSWHRTVPREQAALGILTQVATVIIAATGLWFLAGCGR
jgi:hypothetical protein